MDQPTRPTQPSIPTGSVINNNLRTWLTGVDTIKRQTRAVYGCLVTGQRLWAQA